MTKQKMTKKIKKSLKIKRREEPHPVIPIENKNKYGFKWKIPKMNQLYFADL